MYQAVQTHAGRIATQMDLDKEETSALYDLLSAHYEEREKDFERLWTSASERTRTAYRQALQKMEELVHA